MLPNFLIIGTQKAATSWLAVCLGEHPQIFIPKKKEIFFFDKYFSRGLEWYESQFAEYNGETAVGEATPNYLYESTASESIFNTLGSIKLIASLRHPVDRAYSAYWHYVRRGLISKNTDFITEFEQDGEFSLRTRGNYFEQVGRYLDQFPQDNLLIVFQEEIIHQPFRILQQCYNLLDVKNEYKPTMLRERINQGDRVLLFHNYIYRFRKLLNKLPRNSQNYIVIQARKVQNYLPVIQKPPQLNPNLRTELFDKYYSKDTKKLAQILNLDMPHWYM